jgi:alkylation response protein AidB-like acyl-CoA dehydrogenase
MQFALTEEQQLIQSTARRFFEEHADSAAVRRAIASESGYDAQVWNTLARDMGWSGIALAPEHGGSGLGWVELALLQFEQGRRLFPSPFFSSVCLGAPLIEAVASAAQARPLLERIAAGDLRIAAALTGPEGRAGFEGVGATLERADGGWRLSGACDFVVHGADAELLLIVARAPGSAGADGLSLVAVPASRAGLERRRRTTLDATRPMASLRFERLAVTASDILGEPQSAAPGIAVALAKARIALAAEAAGGAEAILERTVAYAKERVQFGRPIGSFQAVKHRLADMMVEAEAAKSAAWYAACVADEMPQELEEAAAIAKSACADAFSACAAGALQLHGGIGFTWEHDAQLYFKRARASGTLLGTPAWQRESLARGLGLGAVPAPAF